ncbi:MAG: dihydrodipicolinate synthase family protein [Planctomycetota bacterium]
MKVQWKGVFPAACTQFNDDESLQIEETLKHLDAMIDSGVHGMVMLGTVGENCSLLYDEKVQLLKATVEHINGRVPVLTGVAEYSTALACKFAKDAEAAGVDGLMVLPAMVYKSDPPETIYHFKTVAAATSLPIMIYNNPVSYGIDIKPETFKQLVDVDNIVAIKESSEDPRRITDLRNEVGDRFTLFCGVDDVFLESYVLGAEGWISGLVNAFPAENALIWDLCEAGQWEEARKVYQWYTPLLHLDTLPKLVQYIKLASQECGYGSERCRAPRLNVEGEERAWVLGIIRKAIETRPAIPAEA